MEGYAAAAARLRTALLDQQKHRRALMDSVSEQAMGDEVNKVMIACEALRIAGAPWLDVLQREGFCWQAFVKASDDVAKFLMRKPSYTARVVQAASSEEGQRLDDTLETPALTPANAFHIWSKALDVFGLRARRNMRSPVSFAGLRKWRLGGPSSDEDERPAIFPDP